MMRHQDPEGGDQPPDRGLVDIIVQVKRLRDGSRRTTNITEVIGMEGDVIVTQELFKFEYLDETPTARSSANIARWAFAPTRSKRPSSTASTSRIWRLASNLSLGHGLLQAPYHYVFNKGRSRLAYRACPPKLPRLPPSHPFRRPLHFTRPVADAVIIGDESSSEFGRVKGVQRVGRVISSCSSSAAFSIRLSARRLSSGSTPSRRASTIADDMGIANFRTSELAISTRAVPSSRKSSARSPTSLDCPTTRRTAAGPALCPRQEFRPHTTRSILVAMIFSSTPVAAGERSWTAMSLSQRARRRRRDPVQDDRQDRSAGNRQAASVEQPATQQSPNPATLHQWA